MGQKKYSVLSVDDSEFMLLMLQNILQDTEFKIVATATNTEEALENFKQHQPDLVTIDINLPHVSGLELLKKLGAIIKENKLSTKCLMVSAANKNKNLEEANKNGAIDFIIKPFKPEALLKTLRKAVQTF